MAHRSRRWDRGARRGRTRCGRTGRCAARSRARWEGCVNGEQERSRVNTPIPGRINRYCLDGVQPISKRNRASRVGTSLDDRPSDENGRTTVVDRYTISPNGGTGESDVRIPRRTTAGIIGPGSQYRR